MLNGSGFPREDNIQHLIEQGYRYLVVSRKRKRSFDEEQAVAVKTAQGQPVKVQRVVNPQTGEVELHYHSELREKVENCSCIFDIHAFHGVKRQAIQDRFAQRFEAELQKLADGLHKKTPPNAMTRYWNGWAE